MKIRFIGDVHGRVGEWKAITEDCEKSIQLGDMGAGFVEIPVLDLNHRFIRGNHDSPEICRNHPNWIPDGHFENDMFFLGGGFSIDWKTRTEGVSWWRDEELTVAELNELVDKFGDLKPEMVCSHDCPQVVANAMFTHHQESSRTRQAMDAMWEIHKPEVWLFGHHHIFFCVGIKGTRFIALEELGFIDMEER